MTTVQTRGSTKRKYEEDTPSFSFPPPTSPTDCLEQTMVKRVILEYVMPKTGKIFRLVKSSKLDPLDIVEDFKGASDFNVYDPLTEFIKTIDGISFI